MRLTRAQNVLRLAGNVQNRVDFWVSAPDPAEGAYDAPSDSLIVRGFLPSAIAASRLRRLQFPVFGGGIASITQGGIDATATEKALRCRIILSLSLLDTGELSVCGSLIRPVTVARDLGVMLQSDLSMKDHVA